MTNPKELYSEFEKSFSNQKLMLEVEARLIGRQKTEKELEEQRITGKEMIDSQTRSAENLKILQDAGVEGLFQEIIDNGRVDKSKHPTISFGKENKYIKLSFNTDDLYKSINYFCRLDILSNKKIGFLDFNISEGTGGHYYIEEEEIFGLIKNGNSLSFYRKPRVGDDPIQYAKFMCFHLEQPKEVEIKNVPEYVASKILEPDVYHY